MKKSLIALAVLAAAGSASAQSSVTLFGIVDATLAWGRGSVADRFQLTNSGYNSSRLGFRGREDLGGGMFATFWLEATVNNDNGTGGATGLNNQATGGGATGTCTVTGATPAVVGVPVTCTSTVALNGTQGLTFNRRSYVSLGGNWGEVLMGREYTPQFWNLTVFDPFGTNGVGTTQTLNSIITGVTAVRASNAIQYSLPRNLGGFYGQAMMYLGENLKTGAATEDDGAGYGVRVGFASGPFNVALALSRTEYAAGDVRQNNIGGQWDFGVAKLMGHISRDEAGATDGRGWLIGGLVPVGPGEIRLAYSQYRTDPGVGADPKSRKLALGYVHNLSKRTALYATYARVRNSDGAAAALNGSTTGVNTSSSGFDLGIRHSF
ncbi:MAG: porin [Burkholderiales bacterium]|nr:porin [Burkholderiales bacterium]